MLIISYESSVPPYSDLDEGYQLFSKKKNSSYIFTMRAVQYSIVTFYKITLLITDLKMLSLEDRVLLPLAEACKHGQRIK